MTLETLVGALRSQESVHEQQHEGKTAKSLRSASRRSVCQPQEPLLKGESPMIATNATRSHTLYSRKAEFVVAEQFTNERWPEGVTRAPSAEDGTSPAPAYFDDGGFMHNISEGDWIVRPAAGKAYVVGRYDFERDYVPVSRQ